jgi:hypothetical protein
MARIRIMLFIIGLLLEALAFLGSHAENVPFVLSIVSPSYVKAKDGLRQMEKIIVLAPNQCGFDELSGLFLKQLALWNPTKDVSSISVLKITREKPVFVFNRLHATEKIPLIFTLSNGQNIKWDLAALTEDVKNLKATRLFLASIVVFVLGVGIQILGFVVVKGRRSGSGLDLGQFISKVKRKKGAGSK